VTTRKQTIDECLMEFFKSFGASLDMRLWIKLIREELDELADALEENDDEAILKEFSDLCYVVVGLSTLLPGDVRANDILPEEEADELRLLMFKVNVSKKVLKEYFDPDILDEAFHRVHESNMSKLGEDGKPLKREDGKILKGPNYKAPDLSDLVEQAQARRERSEASIQ